MSIKTSESITGLIVGDPRIHREDVQSHVCIRIQIRYYERDEHGASVERDRFCDLIQYGQGAEQSARWFRPGDRFLAQGYVSRRTETINGQQHTIENFVAKRIAHDPNTTTYHVHRARDSERNAPAAGRASATCSVPSTPTRSPGASRQREDLGL